MPDFIELAQKSINVFKSSLGSEDVEKYVDTLCVAISQNNEVSCAKDLSILYGAYLNTLPFSFSCIKVA